ncbi:glycosyltransferase family 9 protein [Fluviispira multicolorata]|uniref:Heptosyltransferase-2 n=1 Tax=Fluviispira multicolorata TaxID=2654512 RepID=A0A833JCL6_9BACT|nr:glycosyltransferase family 9 protein [Fluviispira multicolorata]KAB8030791.1 hypothetical protein GCL57_07400 [Fluviispira multicolorata]
MKVGIFHSAFIGDLALCGLLIEGLYLEKHEIYLIVKKPSAILYKNDTRLTNIISIQKKRGLKKLSSISHIADEIKKLNLDVILVPHQSATSAFSTFLSKIKKRISYNKNSFKFLYTELREFNVKHHESVRCLDLAPEWLISEKIRNELMRINRPILRPTDNLNSFLNKFPNFFKVHKYFFIVNPGSVWATKKYPLEYLFSAVKTLMNMNIEIACIVSGGEQDKKDIEKFIELLNSNKEISERIYNTLDCLPLNELVALTARAQFIIANDSAPLHIASGTNTPSIGIFGPTDWESGFAPASEKNVVLSYKNALNKSLSCQPCSKHGHKVCPQKHFRCMSDLKSNYLVDSVLALVPEIFT